VVAASDLVIGTTGLVAFVSKTEEINKIICMFQDFTRRAIESIARGSWRATFSSRAGVTSAFLGLVIKDRDLRLCVTTVAINHRIVRTITTFADLAARLFIKRTFTEHFF